MRLIDADLLKKNLTGVEIAQYLENGTITDTYDGSTVMISIHTPIKGVTFIDWCKSHVNRDFNPHTHKGCDFGDFKDLETCMNFNPHTHKGCDTYSEIKQIIDTISIHTPIKGVTANIASFHLAKLLFL